MFNDQAIVIFHKKSKLFWCPDGVASAAIAAKYTKRIDQFLFGTYTNDDEIISQIGKGNIIYFVDYSMSTENIEALAQNNAIRIFDHHKTAKDNLSRIPSPLVAKYFDMAKSGARLTWEYFCPGEEVPAIIQYLEVGDLYTFALPEAKKVCAGLYTLMSHEKDMWEVFQALYENWELTQEQLIEKFVPIGEQSLVERSLRVDKFVEKAYPQSIHGSKVLVVEYPEVDTDLVSTIGNRLYTAHPEIDFAVMVNINEVDGLCYVSFRSSGFNCEPIAKSFGGGGHAQACGCTVKELDDLFD
jgi:uncharacterized protein